MIMYQNFLINLITAQFSKYYTKMILAVLYNAREC